MTLRRLLAGALVALALLFALPAWAAQGAVCIPTTGTFSGLTTAGYMNTAMAALLSANSGSSAPANTCSGTPAAGQVWLNTSTSPYPLEYYDGSQWVTLGTLDPSGHTFTVSSAGTVTHTTGSLTASQIVVGNGSGDLKTLGSLGTTTTLLHGNASGGPSYAAVAYADMASGALAAGSDVQANTASKIATPAAIWGAGSVTALTDASTIAVDLSTGINFSVTLGGNRTLGAPSNGKAGQSGIIRVTQDGSGSRTLAYNAAYKFAGGTACTLTTTAGHTDYLLYFYYTSSEILISCALNVSELGQHNFALLEALV